MRNPYSKDSVRIPHMLPNKLLISIPSFINSNGNENWTQLSRIRLVVNLISLHFNASYTFNLISIGPNFEALNQRIVLLCVGFMCNPTLWVPLGLTFDQCGTFDTLVVPWSSTRTRFTLIEHLLPIGLNMKRIYS